MKTRKIILAAITVAIVSLVAAPALARTFVNATGEWEFRYPSEFLIKESSATDWSLANFSLGRPRELSDGQFRVDFSIDSTGVDSVQQLVQRLCTDSDGLEANECDEANINGKSWARILSGGGNNEPTQLTVATVARGKRFQAVATIPDGDEESVSLGTVEAIYATFDLSATGTPTSNGRNPRGIIGADDNGGGSRTGASGVARTGSETVVMTIIGAFVLAIGGVFRLAVRRH